MNGIITRLGSKENKSNDNYFKNMYKKQIKEKNDLPIADQDVLHMQGKLWKKA